MPRGWAVWENACCSSLYRSETTGRHEPQVVVRKEDAPAGLVVPFARDRGRTYVSPRPAGSQPNGEPAMSSRLTAKDVKNQEFNRKMRGYDPEQVDMFLTSVSDEIGRLNLENGKRMEETGSLRKELGGLRSSEDAIPTWPSCA